MDDPREDDGSTIPPGSAVVGRMTRRGHDGCCDSAAVRAAAAPAGLEVLVAPVDVVVSEDTVLQPDVLVAPRGAFTDRDLPGAPMLAVEVLSASTRRLDLLLKRDRYRSAGCASYWVVDPDEPGVLAWRLAGSSYLEDGRAVGEERLEVVHPFPVTLRPADLVR